MADTAQFRLGAVKEQASSRAGLAAPVCRPKGVNKPAGDVIDGLQIKVFTSFADAASLWEEFEKHAQCYIYQCYFWTHSWYETLAGPHTRPLIVVALDQQGEPQALFPLCMETGVFGRVVKFMGDGASDYLAPLFTPALLGLLDNTAMRCLWQRVRAALPAHDLVWLERQPCRINEAANPMHALCPLPYGISGHALYFPKADNWSQCARSLRSNKTVKKIERRLNRFSELAPTRVEEVTGHDQRGGFINDLIGMKIQNLDDQGRLHKMDNPSILAFFRKLADSEADGGRLRLFRLVHGDNTAALTLAMTWNRRFYYQVCASDQRRYARHSPGLLLLYKLFELAFSSRITCYDMTIGDEAYKLDWANKQIELKAGYQAATMRGRLAAMAKLAWLRSTIFLKNNETLLPILIRLKTLLIR